MNNKKLNNDLTIWRRPKGKTTKDVAKEMGYSDQTMRNILSGQQSGGINFWIMLEHVTGLKKEDYKGE